MKKLILIIILICVLSAHIKVDGDNISINYKELVLSICDTVEWGIAHIESRLKH